MARIWYSVIGEGLGHAVRSEAILRGLEREHEVRITASDRAYEYLSERFLNVERIEGGGWIYEQNRLRPVKSALRLLLHLPWKAWRNLRFCRRLLKEFKPALIISDFEPTALIMARLSRTPVIAVDNIHSLRECEINLLRKRDWHLFWALWLLISPLFPRADKYLIPSFDKPAVKEATRTTLVQPIVRERVRRLKPRQGRHVLVYQTSPTNRQMLPVLERSKREFRIYGMKPERRAKNLRFKPQSEEGFLEDLRSCAYVIVNGGFTLISEALELGKPVLAIPIGNQTEQLYNGHALRRRKYGDFTKELKRADLHRFEQRLPRYRAALRGYSGSDPGEVGRLINRFLAANARARSRHSR